VLAEAAACVFGLGVGLAAAELLVRLGVPEQEFWSLAPVYRQVEAPGVHYTIEPNLDDTVYGVDLRTNALGFRGPTWAMPKPAGSFASPWPATRTASVSACRSARRRVRSPPSSADEAGRRGREPRRQRLQQRARARLLRVRALEPNLIVIQVSSNDHDPPVRGQHWVSDGASPGAQTRGG
jgi:hypothetical protein